MSSAEKVLSVARSYLGVKESDGSHMKVVNKYNSYFGGYNLTSKDSWCDAYVSVVFKEAGALDLIGGYECGVQRHIDLFKKAGIWEEDGRITPSAGDIICFNWDDNTQGNDGWADHIGIVEKVSGNKITTIEGNYGNACKQRVTYVGTGNIRGYARPKYSGSTPTPAPAPTPSGKETVAEIAHSLVYGNGRSVWGDGDARKKNLEAAGYNYSDVQAEVNKLLGGGGGSTPTPVPAGPTYSIGSVYTVQVNDLNVRTGPGTNYRVKAKSELTASGQKGADAQGQYKKGTRVTCKSTSIVGKDTWLKTPSGWICAVYNGKTYVK